MFPPRKTWSATIRRLPVTARAPTVASDLDDRQRLSHYLVGEGDPVPDWTSRPGLRDRLTG